MMTATEGRREGDARMRIGMALAVLHKEHAIKKAQLAMLEAAMRRTDRSCTSDDMPADLADEYHDGGKWVGAAVHGLAMARIIERVGQVRSARPSRHGTEVKLWRIPDEQKAHLFMRALRLWLQHNPLPGGCDEPWPDPPDLFANIKAPEANRGPQ